MDIKKASAKDFDKILEIWNSNEEIVDFSKDKYDKKYLNDIGKSKKDTIYVGKLNKQVISTLHIKLEPKRGYCFVDKIVVDTLFKNKGVGTKMLKEAEKIARKKKCKKSVVLSYEDNEPMINFMEKNKYTEKAKIIMFERKL